MSAILIILQQPWVYALGWTLLHSLWQCALIACVCAALLFFTKQATANFRSLIAFAGLLMCVLASTLTFYRYLPADTDTIEITIDSAPVLQTATQHISFNAITFLNSHINTLVLMWFLGFVIYAVKTLQEYRYCHLIKNTHIAKTPEKWQRIFTELCGKVGVYKNVELRISELVPIPCVIGHIKPIVLIPLGLLLSMNQQQIESILLHELGHVKRNDYLVALIQSLIKTLFFFNPFLLWISNQIDKEREHACDDIAVNINQNPLLFANTLKEFADMNMNLKTAMSINGNKLLLTRVTRLFTQPQKATSVKSRLLATLLIIASGGVVLCVNADNANNEEKTVTLKMEKPLPTAEAFALAITEINQQCGTNVTLEPIKHKDGIKQFKMDSMKCSHAIRRLTGMVAVENVDVPKNGKIATLKISHQPVANAIAEVNKQCGTKATVPENIRNELADFDLIEMPCEKMILFVQNYTK